MNTFNLMDYFEKGGQEKAGLASLVVGIRRDTVSKAISVVEELQPTAATNVDMVPAETYAVAPANLAWQTQPNIATSPESVTDNVYPLPNNFDPNSETAALARLAADARNALGGIYEEAA